MVTGRIAPGQILSPVRRIFKNVTIHVGEIETIHLDTQIVTTSRYLDGRQYQIPYNNLIVIVGSVDNLTSYPGLAEHAFKHLKDFLVG